MDGWLPETEKSESGNTVLVDVEIDSATSIASRIHQLVGSFQTIVDDFKFKSHVSA